MCTNAHTRARVLLIVPLLLVVVHRYADRAKQIMCKAIVNEDPNAKVHRYTCMGCNCVYSIYLLCMSLFECLLHSQLIRDLKDEVARLREFIKAEGLEGKMAGLAGVLAMGMGASEGMSKQQAMEKLKEAEKLMGELNLSWEDKLMKTQLIMKER